jgi:hypothetical protein
MHRLLHVLHDLLDCLFTLVLDKPMSDCINRRSESLQFTPCKERLTERLIFIKTDKCLAKSLRLIIESVEEEERPYPSGSLLPKAFLHRTRSRLLHFPQHQVLLGLCLRRCSIRLMLRPTKLLALLDWSDRECHSGRRGRIHPSLPGASHPDPESGMTTQPSWERTVAGLSPAGALPVQAARSVAKFISHTTY